MATETVVNVRKTRIKNNEIIEDAYYLIYLFNKENIKITHLKLQKLMYLFEAYYMNVENVSELYKCNFEAWISGPINSQLYRKFNETKEQNIILTDEQRKRAEKINSTKKKLLEKLFNVFKSFTLEQISNFIYADSSPWSQAWNKKSYSIINKKGMKNWFSNYVQ